MFSILGMILILAGDVLLSGYCCKERKKKLDCLFEMTLYLREITCMIYDFKLPLEDAMQRQSNTGTWSRFLWEYITNNPEKGIRTSLLEGLQLLPLPEEDAKNNLAEYFRQLGKSPKEQTAEHYKSVAGQLEQLYHMKKEEYKKQNRLSAGAVYAISLAAAILLW
ncbi:MAG: hypothetical protein J6A61_02240 [Clostridia bacterium]|nr:hypothetical protein [Clostridia bacterium]